MGTDRVTIRTPAGECPAFVCTPDDGRPAPGVIFYTDGFGVRPTTVAMAERLAALGYVVLLPNLFYRVGPYEPLDPAAVFASGDVRGAIGHLLASTDTARAAADTAAFLDYLASRDDVVGSTVGTTGYCMGGGISLAVAGTYPDRVAAAASFHGAGLVNDTERARTCWFPPLRPGCTSPAPTTTTATRPRWRQSSTGSSPAPVSTTGARSTPMPGTGSR